MHEILPMRFLTLGVDLQFFPQEPGSSLQNYNSPLGTKNAK